MAEILYDRAVVSVAGPDAATFLQGLITADINEVTPAQARSGALLSPQGKVLFDFLIVTIDAGFALDCHSQAAGDLVKRLGLYRLRAKIDIAVSNLGVQWNADAALEGGFADPRHPGLGWRAISANPAGQASQTYHQRRITLGIAEGVHDFMSGTVFPHEANFDLLGGVSFSKGCYIGQEVVSRTHHRGTARKRFLPCRASGPLPAMGTDIEADGRIVGTTGSSVSIDGENWLMALLRLSAAGQDGAALSAGDCVLTPKIPDWAADIVASTTSEANK